MCGVKWAATTWLVAAVRGLNPHLTTELKIYTYLRQGRNYDGQINARREYCLV